MRYLIFALLTFLSISIFAQSPDVDTIIITKIYKSYFDFETRQPFQLSYILHKGGGDCNRSKFRFKNDTNIFTATVKDYSKTGFDMGHLANAEDFAYDCELGELTFRMYNCIPQYPNLNRGVWKKWESRIRKESQSDSLLVICGAVFSDKKVGDNLYVPDYCYKVVKSTITGEIKWVIWFKNVKEDAEKFSEIISIHELEKRLGFKIDLKY
jgi:endonuclease G